MKVVRAFWTLSDNMETYQYSVPDAFLHYFHTSQRGGHVRLPNCRVANYTAYRVGLAWPTSCVGKIETDTGFGCAIFSESFT